MYNQYIQWLQPNISYDRHHVYKKTENGKDIELQEVGPRFEMKSEYTQFYIQWKIYAFFGANFVLIRLHNKKDITMYCPIVIFFFDLILKILVLCFSLFPSLLQFTR